GEKRATGAADPAADGFIGEGVSILGRNVEGGHLVGEVADGDREIAIFTEAGGIDAHGAACLPISIEGSAGEFTNFLETAALLIVEDKIRGRIVSDDEIDP